MDPVIVGGGVALLVVIFVMFLIVKLSAKGARAETELDHAEMDRTATREGLEVLAEPAPTGDGVDDAIDEWMQDDRRS